MLPNQRTTRGEVVTLPGDVEALVVAAGTAEARPLVHFLRDQGINIQLAHDADNAFERALVQRPSIVLIDDGIPPQGGIELCQRLKGNTGTHFVPAILFARADDQEHRLRALAAGVDAVFGPSTDVLERRTRLWALLRTQAIFRRQEKNRDVRGTEPKDRRRWLGGFVRELQDAMATLEANFDYLSLGAHEDVTCVRDSKALFADLTRGFRAVLDFDRLENGQVPLRSGVVGMVDLLSEVKVELDGPARQLGRSIEIEKMATGLQVAADPDLLRMGFIHLLGYVMRNRTRFQSTVRVIARGESLRISAAGDGESVPSAEREQIFEPFGKSASGPVGSSVALALAKAVFDMHGGAVWVEDLPGQPSAFVVELKAEGHSPKLRSIE